MDENPGQWLDRRYYLLPVLHPDQIQFTGQPFITSDQISKSIAEECPSLSSYYGNLLINVAKKSVLKIHPDIKRQICKKCRCMLIDNVTAKIKIKSKNKSKFVMFTCLNCKTQKKLPADSKKDHSLWVEKPEAVVEVIH